MRIVFSVYYKDGDYSVEQFDTDEELLTYLESYIKDNFGHYIGYLKEGPPCDCEQDEQEQDEPLCICGVEDPSKCYCKDYDYPDRCSCCNPTQLDLIDLEEFAINLGSYILDHEAGYGIVYISQPLNPVV